MSSSEYTTSAKALRFDDDSLWVELVDGRVLGVPLAWFPRLRRAGRGHLRGRLVGWASGSCGEAADGGVITW